VERGSVRVLTPTTQEIAEAARRVAAAMRFTPARLRGAPVAVWVSHPVSFSRLAGGGAPAP
jgi:hypothetical protein